MEFEIENSTFFIKKMCYFVIWKTNKNSIMKKTVILFFCMLVTFSVYSKIMDSRHIELQAKQAGSEALRSVIPVSALLERNVILLNFLNSPENVTVTVMDAEGNEILAEVYSSPQSVKLHEIKASGVYKLEVVYGDVCLYGDFVIE